MARMKKTASDVTVTDDDGDRIQIRLGGDEGGNYYITVTPKGAHSDDGVTAQISRKWLFDMIDHIETVRSGQ